MKRTMSIAVVAVAALVLISGAFLAATTSAPTGTTGSTTGTTTTSSATATITSSTSSTSSTEPGQSTSTSQVNPGDSLRLELSLNLTAVTPGEPFLVTVSEYNTLSTTNNVSVAASWAVPGLGLGGCGSTSHPNLDPLGVAIFPGHYTAGNVSQGKPLAIEPPVECPVYVRNETGYLFQPQSDLALVLQNSGGGSPVQISGDVTVLHEYVGESPSQTGQPLAPGLYTVVGGDEWGNLAFLYITVQ